MYLEARDGFTKWVGSKLLWKQGFRQSYSKKCFRKSAPLFKSKMWRHAQCVNSNLDANIGMETSRGQWLLVDPFFQNGRILVDKEKFSWALLVNSRGHFLFTRIPLLGWIFMDIFLVNSSGHFLMVITNSANTVGQPTGAKFLLGSAKLGLVRFG